MIHAASLIGTHDIALITLDTLRYDVACDALAAGRTPNLAAVLPGGRWELRHSPASFTYAAHQAFFAGFLPTPALPGKHARLFAARFAGSETTTDGTAVFDQPDIVSGLAARGYHTVCIGGVGFFNKQTALGSVLPAMFAESHWSAEMGVTSPTSTELQMEMARKILSQLSRQKRVFLFINISAVHQPNCIFTSGISAAGVSSAGEAEALVRPAPMRDSKDTMATALAYVDGWLGDLFALFRRRNSTLVVICSDHGTAYGEEGFEGHRIGHQVVWDVPYAEFVLEHLE